MVRCAIVDNQFGGTVVNAVEYAFVPVGDVPGFPPGHRAIAHPRAGPGWLWDGTNLTDPVPPLPPDQPRRDPIKRLLKAMVLAGKLTRAEALAIANDFDNDDGSGSI